LKEIEQDCGSLGHVLIQYRIMDDLGRSRIDLLCHIDWTAPHPGGQSGLIVGELRGEWVTGRGNPAQFFVGTWFGALWVAPSPEAAAAG